MFDKIYSRITMVKFIYSYDRKLQFWFCGSITFFYAAIYKNGCCYFDEYFAFICFSLSFVYASLM